MCNLFLSNKQYSNTGFENSEQDLEEAVVIDEFEGVK